MSSQPDEQFSDPRQSIKIGLGDIASGDRAATAGDRLVYRVAGGPPGKRLESVIQITGTGELSASFLDEMAGIARQDRTIKLPPAEVAKLIRAVVDSGLLDERETGGPFLPDSVIASLTVESGGASVKHHFLRDAGRRAAQGHELSQPLRILHPILETLSARAIRGLTSTRRKAERGGT